jgi:DNA-binding MarR family transcriptional regulator
MPSNVRMKPEVCNCLALREATRHVTQFYDQFLASSGLRSTQFSILIRLRLAGPMTINALAKSLVMDRTTLGRNILPLERDGLIEVKPVATDRRAKELRLTHAGEKRVQAGSKAWAQAQTQFEATFGTKRAAELRTMLRAVVGSEFNPKGQSVSL